MQITEKTKFAAVAELLELMTEECVQQLKKGAEAKYGSPWGLALGDFFDCSEADFSVIGADLTKPMELTAFQYFWIDSFREMCDKFTATVERLAVPQTADAKKASVGCLKMTFKESVLVFCRDYFGLPNFRAAAELTIDDYLLAKKDAYNKAIFEKGMADIQHQKINKK